MKRNVYIFCSVLLCMNMHNSFGMQNEGTLLAGVKKSPSCENFKSQSCDNLLKFQHVGRLPRDNRQAIETIGEQLNFFGALVSNKGKSFYDSSIAAYNNIWSRLSIIELLLAALVKKQGMLGEESYRDAVKNALTKYESEKQGQTKPDWETYLLKSILERTQEVQPELFTSPNSLQEKKEANN